MRFFSVFYIFRQLLFFFFFIDSISTKLDRLNKKVNLLQLHFVNKTSKSPIFYSNNKLVPRQVERRERMSPIPNLRLKRSCTCGFFVCNYCSAKIMHQSVCVYKEGTNKRERKRKRMNEWIVKRGIPAFENHLFRLYENDVVN